MESESKGPTGQCPSFIENIPPKLLSEIIGFLDMSESTLNFLRVLKEYSKSNRLSIDAVTDVCSRNTYVRCLQIDAFALECFTHLQLPFLGNASLTTEADAVEEVEVVVKILQLTRCLKQLQLVRNKYAMDCDFPTSKLPRIEDLQNAITNLKYLKCLKVSGLIFHPSFFLIPPESVTILGLRQTVSISWWRKFAQCPLVNVTELKMKASYLGTRLDGDPSGWLGEDDKEANEAKDKNCKFFLGGLAMQNLREFVSFRPYFYWPEDFWDLLLERNKGLEKK
ncbi:hypothetical protein TWF569_007081 [Orbilia oligospora]|nr:hypothetical protein TWF569_007081 [Orbilia oligospora]